MSIMTRRLAAHDMFEDGATFNQLQEGALERVPMDPGVYLVLTPKTGAVITSASCGGRFKQKDPTVEVELLQARWIDGAPVVYIGKANNLRRRIREFVSFGAGRPAGHWGGRYVWQLDGCQELTVRWILTPHDDPREVERRLLAEFSAQFGRPPFANINA